ncbi:MATE family efflux transporter [Falsiroseomonas tokyonensis]|uniref:Polysaccharide biosynthesis protein n=1 Tax=Falsiroseomonas tokyonensis TaxID=430521 RepID=A0ABV7C4B2_9PROT|nr:hypothetical protein [Falsiroseomonas tokyonensis]MBU8541469.1 hypothetical protein [Falsiroseomonas tokyonensis]
MSIRLHLSRISWSLIDQGVVSGGTFLLNVLLARGLPATEYGVFAMLFGGMLTLQLVNTTQVLHPLSVRLVTAAPADQPRLLTASLVLIAGNSLVLGAMLALVVALLGAPGLVLPALACFVAWQLQEGVRRGLLSVFRFRAATLGDAVSYLGQAGFVLGLSAGGMLTLSGALYGMAATSALGAAGQVLQLKLRHCGPLRLRATVLDYLSIGGGWALGNGLLLHGRAQILLWFLAATSGAAAVASFQAVLNVVNLTGPILLSLCNIIPPTASQARSRGLAEAWRASRVYAVIVAPLVLAFAALVMAVPETMLWLLYGPQSDYLGLSTALRLLIVATLLGYAADVVASFLHGVSAVQLAFQVAIIGAVATLLIAPPLIGPFGLIGICLTHLGANLVRLIASWIVLSRLIGPAPAARAVGSA